MRAPRATAWPVRRAAAIRDIALATPVVVAAAGPTWWLLGRPASFPATVAVLYATLAVVVLRGLPSDTPGPGIGAANRVTLLRAALALPVGALALFPVALDTAGAWWVIVLQLLFFVVLDDFLFYWVHRGMHESRWLFKKVHSTHHRIMTPWAITGHYMHPAEYVLTGTVMLIGPLLVGAHVVTLYLWIILRQWEAAEGHAGYDFPWSPTHLIPFSDGARHHDFHHAKVKGNYAGFFPWTDAAFGTLCAGYKGTRSTSET